MSLTLSSSITDIPGIGPAKAKLFKKLDISYVRDLLFFFPRRYDDFSEATAINKLEVGKQMTVHGRVKSVQSKYGFQGRRRLLRIFVDIEDDTGVLHVTWFNLRFLEKQLTPGREIYVAGRVEPYKYAASKQGEPSHYTMRSPALEFPDRGGERTHTAAITPVYSETHGVSSRFIRYKVRQLLPLIQVIPEYIPKDIIKRHELVSIHEALKAAHFPESKEQLEVAQRRLRFDELFFLQLAALVRRQHIQHDPAFPISTSNETVKQWVNEELPFPLTKAQERAVQEVLEDLKEDHPMNRLLQGDVGSGKSVVALIAAHAVLNAGYKVMYLAPTEILARQQAEYFAKHLPAGDVHLLIGAMKEREKRAIKEKLNVGDSTVCIVGTHALLQEDVRGEKVGLAIIDEQHRFGVAQRKALHTINGEDSSVPHLLSMTATPIPRTLSLTVYGDLDVSVLDELPPGRQPIETRVVSPGKRDEAIIFTLEQLHQGRQAYVITPLIETSEKMELKSAKQAYEEMTKLFPGVAVGLMHGQMPAEEKEAVMRNFAAGAIQLLVSTSVVEVGVNVPNATVMIIEGAERFGLSQLHQFRGRVGRGEDKSYCFLFPTTDEVSHSERLHVIARTTDGFEIAEEDLRLRGPGEVYGLAQSGFGNLKVSSLLDYATIKIARQEAGRILKKDPELNSYPILQAKVRQKNLQTHFE